MSKNSIDERRWEELNALVDGELDRARAAEIAAWIARDQDAARAFASIAQLTATTAGLASRNAGRLKERGRGARIAAVLAIGAALGALLTHLTYPGAEAPEAQAVALAPRALGLSDDVTIGDVRLPNLQRGGLRLDRVGIVPDGAGARLEAAYIGERGCRVRLVVAAAAQAANTPPGDPPSQTTQWKVGAYVYTMTSERMDPDRFVVVAMIAQAETAPSRATQFASAASNAVKRPCLG